MNVQAVSVESGLRDALNRGALRGAVLSAHRDAAYLDTGDGSLIVLAREEVGNGPGFVLLRGISSFAEGPAAVVPGEPYETAGSLIRIAGGRVEIETRAAREWDAALSPRASAAGAGACAESALRAAQARGPGGVLGPLFDLVPGRGAGAPRGLAGRRIAALADALAAGDERAIEGAAGALIGLGDGLTPSCDDLLAGIAGFCGCAPVGSSRGAWARAVVRAIGAALAERGGRTTPVSRHFLGEALRGRFTERAKSLCEAIADGDDKRVAAAAARVLEYGATSGADLILGIALGCRSAPAPVKEGT